jgi:hypothetical protein
MIPCDDRGGMQRIGDRGALSPIAKKWRGVAGDERFLEKIRRRQSSFAFFKRGTKGFLRNIGGRYLGTDL